MPWSTVIALGSGRLRATACQGVNDALSGERETGLQHHTLATPFIDAP